MRFCVGLIVFAWATLVGAAPAGAAQIAVFSPPYDFALLDPQSPPPPGGPYPYAITGGSPGWNIASWDIPGGKLSPFKTSPAGMNTLFTASAAQAMVKIAHVPDGTAVYQFSQNGAVLPCDENGRPREADLFASPNAAGTKPPDQAGMLIPQGETLMLGGLAQLISTVTVTLQYGVAAGKTCSVAQGDPLLSVVLNDPVQHQTLAYQLALSNVCGPQPAARVRACEDWGAHPRGVFYYRRDPFAVDDTLPSYGQPWLADNETRQITIDLLPHLLKFIASGPPAMDHNPADWTLGAYFNGQHIWGGLTMTTTWKNVSLVAITK
jgi:hypothetical protein